VQPESRRNEVLGWVREGVRDFSISRAAVEWGIPIPRDPQQTVYVWFDALNGYLSGGWRAAGLGGGLPGRWQHIAAREGSARGPCGGSPLAREPPCLPAPCPCAGLFPDGTQPDASPEALRSAGWPASLHIIGKDILRFHAVYWPAMLLSAGLPPPRRVYGHGFLTKDGLKMGKSLGNVLEPRALVAAYGADAVRFYFLREIVFGQVGGAHPHAGQAGPFTWLATARPQARVGGPPALKPLRAMP
jgi:methionyl-tRNA synthetase